MLANHETRNDLGAKNCAFEIGADDLLPIRWLHAHQQTIGGNAGIIDENINFPVPVNDVFHRRFDLIFIGDIEATKLSLTTLGGDRVQRRVSGGLVAAIVDDDIGAGAAERQSNRFADSPARAGDESDLTLESHWLYVAATRERSCGESKLSTSIDGTMRLIKPFKTLPGQIPKARRHPS